MELKFACGFHIFLALQRQISVKELAQRLLYIIYVCFVVCKTWLVFVAKREMQTLSRCRRRTPAVVSDGLDIKP